MVGGGDKGGVLVRQGKALTSEQLPQRLSTGALVKELKLEGDRLQFQLTETGTGPATGWVSLKLKDKELLVLVEGEKPAKDALKKKSWDIKFLFSGCGANLRALEGGTEGASREQLFEFLMRQHVSPEMRRDFWEQIPEHLYDTGQTNETDVITFFQTVGHLCPAEGKRLASPGGVRQRVAFDLPLRCIMVEPDGTDEAKLLVVLCHGIEVLGHDLYTLAHHLCAPERRICLPEAPRESAEPREEEIVVQVEGLPIDESNSDLPEWRKPLREWWSRSAKEKEIEKCLSEAADALATVCKSAGDAKVVLGGFSQGAAVALAAASKVPKLAGLVLMSPPGFAAKLAPAQAPPCLVTSGSEDPIAPRDQVEGVHQALGPSSDLLAFEGSHEVTMTVVEGVKAFLAKLGR